MIGRYTIHWRDRIADLRDLHDGKARTLAPAIGIGYETLGSWLWRDKLPLLSMAYRVSSLSGYTLEHLVGAEPLPKHPDFAPVDDEYQHGTWPRGLRLVCPGMADYAISQRISERSLMALRVPSGWFYMLRVPLLASAIETARALDTDVDMILRLGRESFAAESAAE